MKRKLVIPLALLVLLGGCVCLLRPTAVYRIFHPVSNQEVIEKVFRNREIYAVMTNSPQVTGQRLHWKSESGTDTPENYSDPALLNGYTREAPVTLTDEQALQLNRLLQKPSSYEWDIATMCLPDYGVVYHFQSGGHSVHVAFCFKCNMVGVFDGDNDASNQVNFEYQFDPMRRQMITLAKELFPKDEEIQKLE
jgi:hypothetical protein